MNACYLKTTARTCCSEYMRTATLVCVYVEFLLLLVASTTYGCGGSVWVCGWMWVGGDVLYVRGGYITHLSVCVCVWLYTHLCVCVCARVRVCGVECVCALRAWPNHACMLLYMSSMYVCTDPLADSTEWAYNVHTHLLNHRIHFHHYPQLRDQPHTHTQVVSHSTSELRKREVSLR